MLALAGQQSFFLQRNWPRLSVNLGVQSASVADNFAGWCASPQCGCCGGTVVAAGAVTFAGGNTGVLGLNQRTVGAVHFVIQSTSVAQIVAGRVAAPQRCVGHAAVDALAVVFNGRNGGGIDDG